MPAELEFASDRRSGVAFRAPKLRTFLTHQAASLLATAVDFSVMIGLVELLHADPALATGCGAFSGGVANFLVNRRWTFDAADEKPTGQAARYALISACSLALNVLGVHLLAGLLAVPYVLARLGTALAVGFLWNFPMHRYFVFPPRDRSAIRVGA